MAKKIHKVKRLRFEMQLKQSELADRLEVDQSLISRIESGEARLTPRIAERLNKIINKNASK